MEKIRSGAKAGKRHTEREKGSACKRNKNNKKEKTN
jgi:hypothetical protein